MNRCQCDTTIVPSLGRVGYSNQVVYQYAGSWNVDYRSLHIDDKISRSCGSLLTRSASVSPAVDYLALSPAPIPGCHLGVYLGMWV